MSKAPKACGIFWFRRDLRLDDHPGLSALLKTGLPIVPVFIDTSIEEPDSKPGAASRWWLHHSLKALDESLQKIGSRLFFRSGPAKRVLASLITETGATHVYWSYRSEPDVKARDKDLQEFLAAKGIQVKAFNSHLLFRPEQVLREGKHPYKVFTAFWNHCQTLSEPSAPSASPKKIPSTEHFPKSDCLDDWGWVSKIPWHQDFLQFGKPGEIGARSALRGFLSGRANEYLTSRDCPSTHGTSRLSAHLHCGDISIRRVWHEVKAAVASGRVPLKQGEGFLRQLAWREFAHHLLLQFPDSIHQPLRSEFKRFPWSKNAGLLKAWQKGLTGYPIVDAGMRELWKTGWMHNRVRMIAASFLVKDLFISWQEGAAWFWDTLVDADLANNTMGWQWVAGSGADAAPYFRIFNPVLQSERFDPEGTYIRKWVPEISKLPAKWIHKPWTAPASVLNDAGITLGLIYPQPIVDHEFARRHALAAFKNLKK